MQSTLPLVVPAFHGWRMVALGFVGQAVAIGFSIGAFSIFVVPIEEAFAADRATIALGSSIFMATMGLTGAIVGPMCDSRPIQYVMAAGAGIMGLCLAAMSQATAIWQLGLLYGVGTAAGVTMLGPVASATLVAKWFRVKLGSAQGVLSMGGPAGAFIVAVLAGLAVENFGWRTTLQIFAGVTLLSAPLMLFGVRSRPEELGQLVDGLPPPDHSATGGVAPVEDLWSFSALAHTPSFWLLALPFGLIMGIGTGWAAHIVPIGLDVGLDIPGASQRLGIGAGLGIIGTLTLGALADRVSGKLLAWAVMGTHVAGFLLLSSTQTAAAFTTTVFACGLVGGGMLPLYASLVGRIFGQASFGQVMGLGGIVMLPISFAAPPIAGALREQHGNYGLALVVFSVGIGLGMLLIGGLRIRRAAQD